MFLGNPDGDIFLGKDSYWVELTVLYFFSSFILFIHLFNMLIALMGDIFKSNNDVKDKLKLKEQLRFILDKWRYKMLFLKDKNGR